MYERKFHLKTSNKCNYVIDLSPKNNSSIFFSFNDQGYIFPKENFLSLEQSDLETSNEKKKFIYQISDRDDTITCSHFTSDDNNILISDQTKSIAKYDLINIDPQNPIHLKRTDIDIPKLRTWKFNISPDNTKLVTGDNNIIIYNLENDSVLKELESKSKFIYSFCFLSNNLISVGNSNGAVQIFDIENNEQISKIEEHCLLVRNLCFNKDKDILYSASDDLHINQIDVNTNKIFSPIIGHKEPISAMTFNEKKKILITAGFDGVIKIWDTNDENKCIETIQLENKSTIWDIAVDNEADFIGYTSSEGIGAYLRK